MNKALILIMMAAVLAFSGEVFAQSATAEVTMNGTDYDYASVNTSKVNCWASVDVVNEDGTGEVRAQAGYGINQYQPLELWEYVYVIQSTSGTSATSRNFTEYGDMKWVIAKVESSSSHLNSYGYAYSAATY